MNNCDSIYQIEVLIDSLENKLPEGICRQLATDDVSTKGAFVKYFPVQKCVIVLPELNAK